jgi:Ni,Fe-hydrogenase maturation factor
MVKILALGNEFIGEDSFAKEISKILSKNHKIINIKDSFQFLYELQSKDEIVILDVVEDLMEVKLIGRDDLRQNNIISVHDLDASFFLQLIKPDVKIIGLPQYSEKEDLPRIIQKVEELLND